MAYRNLAKKIDRSFGGPTAPRKRFVLPQEPEAQVDISYRDNAISHPLAV